MGMGTQRWAYGLEQLYDDQDPRYAADAIAQLLCWLEPEGTEGSRCFQVREPQPDGPALHELTLSWQIATLTERDPRLDEDLRRFRNGKTAALLDRPDSAAFGLALVAISCLLHRRVSGIRCFHPPNLLFSSEPGEVRGVSVAGFSSAGFAALLAAADGNAVETGKRAEAIATPDIAEAYLSLWCREPRVAVWESVKP